MVGCRRITITKKKSRSDWLTTLLESEFFRSCGLHRYLRKNEQNLFCIDCSRGLCKHCSIMSGHDLHRRLQICKYVYQDVVRLPDLQKHLDCSQIQTYKINGEKAVHLNPRPQSKDAKPSTKSKNAATSEACGRYIQDLPNRFCSLACKVLVVPHKPKDQSHGLVTFPGVELNGPTFLLKRARVQYATQMMEHARAHGLSRRSGPGSGLLCGLGSGCLREKAFLVYMINYMLD